MRMSELSPSDWADYRRDRKLGDYTPAWRSALGPHILKRRAERIAEIEAKYPDIRATYDEQER